MNQGEQTDVILLDFLKAFDKVPNNRLLHKMHNYDIQEVTLQWIEDFLSNRAQFVLLEGHKSGPLHVISGVPRGKLSGLYYYLHILMTFHKQHLRNQGFSQMTAKCTGKSRTKVIVRYSRKTLQSTM